VAELARAVGGQQARTFARVLDLPQRLLPAGVIEADLSEPDSDNEVIKTEPTSNE
jgi:hypothetical protein